MAVLLTAGCGLFGGDSENNEGSSESTGNASGKLEKTTIKIGVMPTIDCSGAQLALLNKSFEEEGLKVEAETLQSGAFGIPKLVNGELDISFGNWVSFIQAQQQKAADLRFVSESYISTPNSNFVLLTNPDSGITDAKGLRGKKIAVNAIGNVNELLIRALLDANDVKFEDVTLVPMKFPEMLPNLQNRQVDVISTFEPFAGQAQKTLGAKVVADLTGAGVAEEWPLSGFAATAKFAKENPNTVAAFQRALAKGQQLAADRKNIQEALPKFAQMDPETAAIVKVGEFPPAIDAKRIQRVSDLLSTYGMLQGELKVEPLVVAAPSGSDN